VYLDEALMTAAKLMKQTESARRIAANQAYIDTQALRALQAQVPAFTPEQRELLERATRQALFTRAFTADVVQEAAKVSGLVVDGALSQEAAIDQIKETAPSLGAILDQYTPKIRMAIIHLLVFIASIAVNIAANQAVAELLDDSATKEDVQDALHEVIEQFQEQQEPSPQALGDPFNERTKEPPNLP
jgi:hypothetical protein